LISSALRRCTRKYPDDSMASNVEDGRLIFRETIVGGSIVTVLKDEIVAPLKTGVPVDMSVEVMIETG
jgi:hypothetical protein